MKIHSDLILNVSGRVRPAAIVDSMVSNAANSDYWSSWRQSWKNWRRGAIRSGATARSLSL